MCDSNSTIFDDVFRTMLAKTPELIIPLINEIFDTEYPPDVTVTRYPNELYNRHKKRITDSHFRIEDTRYHGECQSTGDSSMHVRMLEYDTAIGLEYISCEKGEYHIHLPKSFVLYLTNTSKTSLPAINLHFADNSNILYHPKPVYLPDYSLEEIFQKNLIFLLPFYIIRYRSKNSSGHLIEGSEDFQHLMDDCRSIRYYLDTKLYTKDTADSRTRIIELSNRIINYIFADNDAVRKGLGDIMGGQVLELEVDRFIEAKNQAIQARDQAIQARNQAIQARDQAIQQERESSIRSLIQILHLKKVPRNEIAELLADNYRLEAEEVENYMSKYWGN